jgi:hypothetical protein
MIGDIILFVALLAVIVLLDRGPKRSGPNTAPCRRRLNKYCLPAGSKHLTCCSFARIILYVLSNIPLPWPETDSLH